MKIEFITNFRKILEAGQKRALLISATGAYVILKAGEKSLFYKGWILSFLFYKMENISKLAKRCISEKKDYRRIGKYKVKEIFGGEESLTSLLTQYVERTVAIRY